MTTANDRPRARAGTSGIGGKCMSDAHEVSSSVEGLRQRRLDDAAVGSVRGLTDLEPWRALRDRGATQEAAVAQAGAALERWLEAQPAS